MKEALVFPTKPFVTTTICNVDLPVPQDNGVLCQEVEQAYYVRGLGKQGAPSNESKIESKIGDRVSPFHPMMTPGGTYAEYTVAPIEKTFLIPDGIGFESASTIALTTLAAALALFRRQSLPPPWMKRSPNTPPIPLIIYGASSALETYAIKLARNSDIHPIIAIVGESASYVKKLLVPYLGDVFIDYRSGTERMKHDIETSLGNMPVFHALDVISEKKSWVTISQVLSPGGTVSVAKTLKVTMKRKSPLVSTSVIVLQPQDTKATLADIDFAYVMFRYIARLLAIGEFEGTSI
ncbi:hypothetical protein PISL3812_00030 [Talaromyces islandicus]|uniref:Enoyl reductase (ER) domain-containing protein n=1 Tax=Talaromyces islandicus TaxID=28573 RepID=A0A0U1LJU5_TALIS|nr:hypothetical protein PISL3812_00030 [Talaromyces islandicus]